MDEGSLTERDLLRWSESLAAIARTGLAFTESLYERERYEEVLAVASDIAMSARRPHDPADLVAEWLAGVGSGTAGYVTPKVAVGAVVGNDDDEILLIQRSDSGVWLYPTGWADVGYSPAEVARKEVKEETGIDVEVERLLGIFDGMRLGFTRNPLYSVVFLCRPVGGELCPHPLECLDVGWFGRDSLPPATVGVDHWGDMAFDAISGNDGPARFDEPRDAVWRAED